MRANVGKSFLFDVSSCVQNCNIKISIKIQWAENSITDELTYEIIGKLNAAAIRPSCTHVSCGPM